MVTAVGARGEAAAQQGIALRPEEVGGGIRERAGSEGRGRGEGERRDCALDGCGILIKAPGLTSLSKGETQCTGR
jgi:hypothetical protein